ncbi:GNAT family N-acetyltransferase [Amycolatopsis jejuensis]|uniref:GNAT family N-acetyltransferase n=1 Tax=Amycolatopsis jejuensis TaxID=330084 RepID=UPI00052412DA|nr:GNAT family N-acetyltransferase [Amycolatopsis jejuensis]
MTGEVSIRQAGQADLAVLAAVLGNQGFFEDRLTRQAKGLGVLFTAWCDARPVGDVYLWLEDAEEPPIRGHLPGVPLLTHLEVAPEARNRGIGAALVRAAEDYLAGQGHALGALAVRTDNTRAARLYRRLGYEDWGHGTVVCYSEHTLPDGRTVSEPEHCHVLVKGFPDDRPVPLVSRTCGGS